MTAFETEMLTTLSAEVLLDRCLIDKKPTSTIMFMIMMQQQKRIFLCYMKMLMTLGE